MIFSVDNISKAYTENVVLDQVSLTMEGGKIYGLIGYNGGGKTTLAQIISGVIPADHGTLCMDGVKIKQWDIKTAMKSGVFLVEQFSTAFHDLSVEENILLGINFIKRNPMLGTFSDRHQFKKRSKELFKKYHIKIDVSQSMGKIPRAAQRMIELIRISLCNPKVVVIDEIDTNIDRYSQKITDQIISDLVSGGCAVLYISHNLEHVLNLADTISVIVDSQLINTWDTTDTDTEGIVDMLLRVSKEKPPRIIVQSQDEIFSMRDITNDNLENFEMEVKEGQITGIYGLDREGEASFGSLLFGKQGDKLFRGEKVHITTPQEALEYGIAFLDSNVMQNYLFAGSTVLENMLPFRIRAKKLSDDLQDEICRRYLEILSVKAQPSDKIEELSTGFQKKVLIVKNILSEGEVYIFDRLTDNIDVVSKVDIYNIINELKRNGKGVVLISNEIKEITGMSDVVYIVKDGKMAHKMINDKQNEKELIDKCLNIDQ